MDSHRVLLNTLVASESFKGLAPGHICIYKFQNAAHLKAWADEKDQSIKVEAETKDMKETVVPWEFKFGGDCFAALWLEDAFQYLYWAEFTAAKRNPIHMSTEDYLTHVMQTQKIPKTMGMTWFFVWRNEEHYQKCRADQKVPPLGCSNIESKYMLEIFGMTEEQAGSCIVLCKAFATAVNDPNVRIIEYTKIRKQ